MIQTLLQISAVNSASVFRLSACQFQSSDEKKHRNIGVVNIRSAFVYLVVALRVLAKHTHRHI